MNQLPIISQPNSQNSNRTTNFIQPAEPLPPQYDNNVQTDQPYDQQRGHSAQPSTDETIELISKLAKLRDSSAITEEDFNSKKVELLARI